MEPKDYIHAEIEGVLTSDMIACTRTPLPLAKELKTTKTLDFVTCPPCRMAMIHRAQQSMGTSRPKTA